MVGNGPRYEDEDDGWLDDGIAWYKRLSVWTATGVGFGLGLLATYIF